MSEENEAEWSRRKVLKSTGVAALGIGAGGFASQSGAAADDEDEFCGVIDSDTSQTTTTSTNCLRDTVAGSVNDRLDPSDVHWPAVSVLEVDGSAGRLSNGDPARSDGKWNAESSCTNGTKLVSYSSSDTYKIAIFWADYSFGSGVRGQASRGPMHLQDNNNDLPDGYDFVDAFVILSDSSSDLYIAAHEFGHAIGYYHCDCGIMSYAKTEDGDFYGETPNLREYLNPTTVAVAEAFSWFSHFPNYSDKNHYEDDGGVGTTQWLYSNGYLTSDEFIWSSQEVDNTPELIRIEPAWYSSLGFDEHHANNGSLQDWDYKAGFYVNWRDVNDKSDEQYSPPLTSSVNPRLSKGGQDVEAYSSQVNSLDRKSCNEHDADGECW